MTLVLWIGLTACHPSTTESGGLDSDTSPSASEPVTFVVGAAGGSASVSDANGATLELSFPEGALEVDTTFVLEAADPGPDLARFTLSPAGVALWAPATATLRGAAGLDAESAFSWVDGDLRTLVPSEGTDELRGSLSVLGGYGQDVTLSSIPTRLSTLAAASIDCAAEADALTAALADGSPAGTPEEMAERWSRHAAIKLRCEVERNAAVAEAACSAYRAAEVGAEAVAVNDFATYQTIVGRLLEARGNVQIAGEETCDTSGYAELLDDKFTQFLTFVGLEFERARQAEDLDASIELFRELAEYGAVCRASAISDNVCGRFTSELFPAVLDILRESAWADCRADDSPWQLAYLHGGTLSPSRQLEEPTPDQVGGTGDFYTFADFTYEDLALDVAHCAAQVEVKVFDDAETVPVELEGQGAALGAGATPGSQVVAATVVAPEDGALELAGSVHALVCADGSISADALVARVNGVEVARSPLDGSHFGLGEAGWDLVIAEVLETAGLPASSTGFSVEIWREGAGCGRTPSNLRMYTLNVQLGAKLAEATLLARGNDFIGDIYGNHLYLSTPLWVDCDEEDSETDTSDVVMTEDLAFPADLVSGTVRLGGVEETTSASVRLDGTVAGPVSDTCTDGSVDTRNGYVTMQYLDVLLSPTAPVTVSLTGADVSRWSFGSVDVYVYPDEATFRASGTWDSRISAPLEELPTFALTPPQVLVFSGIYTEPGPVTFEATEILRLGYRATSE